MECHSHRCRSQCSGCPILGAPTRAQLAHPSDTLLAPHLVQGAAGQRDPEDHHHPRRHAARAQPGAPRAPPRLAAQEGGWGAVQGEESSYNTCKDRGLSSNGCASCCSLIALACCVQHQLSRSPPCTKCPATLPTPTCEQVQEKEDTYKQTRIDALFGAARVSPERVKGICAGSAALQGFMLSVLGELADCRQPKHVVVNHPRHLPLTACHSPSGGRSWPWKAASNSSSSRAQQQ